MTYGKGEKMSINDWIQANSILIALGVSILVLIYLIKEIIKCIRRRLTKRQRLAVSPLTYILLILAYIFFIYIVFSASEIKQADWAQILLMIGLVAITATYAWSTEKMAKEIREQRLSEARPYLLLRLKGEAVQWDKNEKGEPPDREFPVTIRNAGKGPAINLWAALWGSKTTYAGDSKGYLAPNEEWETTISRVSVRFVESGIKKEGWLPELRKSIKQEYPGVIAVKCSDIYHRAWVSYLCLERHVDVEYFVIEEEQNIVELKSHD